MPRVHSVRRAQKNYPHDKIKKGEPYYWWQFRYGPKIRSRTYPKASQLTQSEFLSQWYDCEERMPTVEGDDHEEVLESIECAMESVDEIKCDIENLKDETEDKACNVEGAFPNGSPVIDQLRERVESAENLTDELQSAYDELSALLQEETEAKPRDRRDFDDLASEANGHMESLDWSVE